MDALLQDEIAERARQRAADRRDQLEKTQPHSRASVLAPIPSDPDHQYPLEVADQSEVKAPDGTLMLAVLYTGKERGDLLRIWRFRQGSYYLAREDKAEPGSHLSAEWFRYEGRAYLHWMEREEGTGYEHADAVFRVESGGLRQLETPEGQLPVALAPGEGVWKGVFETFEDDHLTFEFGIWKQGDANCCPTAGWVKGTYTIVGDKLKYATWKRSNEIPKRGQ
jgi:hypothetical protein